MQQCEFCVNTLLPLIKKHPLFVLSHIANNFFKHFFFGENFFLLLLIVSPRRAERRVKCEERGYILIYVYGVWVVGGRKILLSRFSQLNFFVCAWMKSSLGFSLCLSFSLSHTQINTDAHTCFIFPFFIRIFFFASFAQLRVVNVMQFWDYILICWVFLVCSSYLGIFS